MCVPLHMLLPFVLAWLHRKGYFMWFKEEWVTYRWWYNLVFPAPKANDKQKKVELAEMKKTT